MSYAHRHDRGSALIISMILMVVLAVVGLALVKRTSREVDAVASKRHWDRAMSCAEGSRQMLLSQFRAYGVNLAGLQLSRVVGDQTYASGHYDNFNVASVGEAGGTPGGIVVGSTDRKGYAADTRVLSPENFVSTIYTKLGINPDKMLFTPQGRPTHLVSDATVIRELM